MNLRHYVLRRLWQTLLTALVIVTLNFFLFRVLPGDPVRILFKDPRISAEAIAAMQADFGLDRPLLAQYGYYLLNLAQGDMGISFVYRRPVTEIIIPRLFNTLLLVGTATVLAILLGVLLGVLTAWRRRTWVDFGGLITGMTLYATPTFWLGLLLILLTVNTGVFPVAGMSRPVALYASRAAYWLDVARHMVLPVTTLTLVLFGQYLLVMRNTLVGVLTEDYVASARAKGFTERRVLWSHAVPNASLPMVTLIALHLGGVVAGSIQTETVFAWPGIGRLIYDSLSQRDYPVLQGAFLIFTFSVLLGNFAADVLYRFLDPRVKG